MEPKIQTCLHSGWECSSTVAVTQVQCQVGTRCVSTTTNYLCICRQYVVHSCNIGIIGNFSTFEITGTGKAISSKIWKRSSIWADTFKYITWITLMIMAFSLYLSMFLSQLLAPRHLYQIQIFDWINWTRTCFIWQFTVT